MEVEDILAGFSTLDVALLVLRLGVLIPLRELHPDASTLGDGIRGGELDY
jgi:hypothetical protein